MDGLLSLRSYLPIISREVSTALARSACDHSLRLRSSAKKIIHFDDKLSEFLNALDNGFDNLNEDLEQLLVDYLSENKKLD